MLRAMSEREKLVQDIEKFLEKSGMSPTRFGIESVGRRSLMHQLRSGGGVNLDTAEKLRNFMKDWKARPKLRAHLQPAA